MECPGNRLNRKSAQRGIAENFRPMFFFQMTLTRVYRKSVFMDTLFIQTGEYRLLNGSDERLRLKIPVDVDLWSKRTRKMAAATQR